MLWFEPHKPRMDLASWLCFASCPCFLGRAMVGCCQKSNRLVLTFEADGTASYSNITAEKAASAWLLADHTVWFGTDHNDRTSLEEENIFAKYSTVIALPCLY